jgi:mannose-6-phosphate isomerase-like protein (cupin superfamily)
VSEPRPGPARRQGLHGLDTSRSEFVHDHPWRSPNLLHIGIPVKSINLASKLSTFSEHWQPRVVGQFNGNDLMVVKVKGEFVWHKHEDTDDFFLVLKGSLDIHLRDGIVTLGPGEMFVVPKGVEHRPVAAEETHVLLIEPQGTPNTGNAATAAARRVI